MSATMILVRVHDKLLLGAAGIFFLAVVSPMLSPPAELAAEEELAQDLDLIEGYVASRRSEVVSAPSWAAGLRADAAVEPASFPGWALHRRPNVIFDRPPSPPPLVIVHGAPLMTLAPGYGRVRVSWTEHPDNTHVFIKGYELERRAIGEQKFRTLARLGAEVMGYQDQVGLRQHRRYEYRLTSIATLDSDDPEVHKSKLSELPESQRRKERLLAAGPLKPEHWLVPQAITQRGIDPVVQLRVLRRLGDGSVVKQTLYGLSLGEEIGRVQVLRGGRRVDFRVGGRVSGLHMESAPHPSIKGHMVKVCVINVKYDDGVVVTFRSDCRASEFSRR